MQLSGLLDLLRNTSAYRALFDSLKAQNGTNEALGLLRAARPFMLAALSQDWHAPVVYVTGRVNRAYNTAEQLPVWLGDNAPVYRFGEPLPDFYERAAWGDAAVRSRIAALNALMRDASVGETQPVIVTSARALMQRTLPANHFRQGSLTLTTGQRSSMEKMLAHLLRVGYEPAPLVIEPGTFSRRGGLIDVFPITDDLPLRIEFFGDEIDVLRRFDPASQRTVERVNVATVTPAREALPQHTPPLAAHLGGWFEMLPAVDSDAATPRADAQPLTDGVPFAYIEHYLPYLYPNPVSLLHYAPEGSLIVVEDPDTLRAAVEELTERAAATRDELVAAGTIPPDHPAPFVDWQTLDASLSQHTTLQFDADSLADDPGTFTALFQPEERFGGQLRPLLDRLRTFRADGERAVVVTQQTPRLTELWGEQAATDYVPTVKTVTDPPEPASLLFANGALREGWRMGDLHLITDAEIFGWSRPEPRRRRTARPVSRSSTHYVDWQDGDPVVHEDYGIGKFAGTRRRTLDDVQREYLVVQYAGTDMIFVPIHQADRLTKYIGAADAEPELNKLGQQDWFRVKRKTRRAVEEEAKELLEIYAKREQVSGYAFGADTPWQHELEASFGYVETEDQLRAVQDVKNDMEMPTPMDRLICGDVGYGKTEVALRAAFKAVVDGKQVAILVPTTVLAQQHYDTFSQRLASFPVVVEMLSRFRTGAQQRDVVAKLKRGEVDIIIGTHRLLSEDIDLSDLGLVVIDEEQRFGVKHKEHFKALRARVDVLTLTATPIPRTLYMSITGVRDISLIQTPPEERLPVITHVGSYDEKLIRQAVLRELERGGQVFVVHNRVRSIYHVAERIRALVPEATVGIGHGQMSGRRLEEAMARFAHGEDDVLVSTSIVESGLDIPNANTLIIDRADWFGMSQLYQLRGRVGRSARQAYAYLFHPGVTKTTEEAFARLETLEENTQLGAGFQIAMRDLEIRGAGDILSTRQSGHVAAVGLHLYTQMLSNAISRMKPGDDADPEAMDQPNITIDLPLAAYLPNAYVEDMSLRLQIYRRIANLTTRDDVEYMRIELEDRFGKLPPAVEGLLYQIDVKLLAQQASATAVIGRGGTASVKLPYLPDVDRDALQVTLGAGVNVTRTAVEIAMQAESWRERLLDLLGQLAERHEETTLTTG